MTPEAAALALVLVAALMHAGWNLIAKLGDDQLVAMAMIKAPNAAVAAAVLVWSGLPAPTSLPYLVLSWAVSSLYFYFLINAYRVGDLSLAYPVARGLAPLCVLALSAYAVGEIPTPGRLGGVALISLAIISLAAHRNPSRQHYATLLWAGGVGLTIACYTVIDGMGGRVSANTVGYVALLNVLTGVTVCGVAVGRRGRATVVALRAHWRNGLAGGTLMLVGYMIIVHALTVAPMAQVAAVRESSVIFAAILAMIFRKEPFGARRIGAATMRAIGIGFLVLAH